MSVAVVNDEAGHPPTRHFVSVMIACIAVYWFGLGYLGLAWHEGNNVVPGWEMLDSKSWLVPRTLGQPDLRRAPGMSWAVAASCWVFGKNEVGARKVSAAAMTVAALLTLHFGARWFGRRAGLVAGLCAAVTPILVLAGRVAENEALWTATSLASVLLQLDLLIASEGARRRWLTAIGAGVITGLVMLVAGPRGLLPTLACIAGVVITTGPRRVVGRGTFWLAVAIGIGMWGGWFAAANQAVREAGQTALVGSVLDLLRPADDLGSPGLRELMTMRGLAVGAALPGLLALPLVLAVRRETDPSSRTVTLGRSIAWTVVISVGLLLLTGVGGFRAGAPFLAGAPMLAGFAYHIAARPGPRSGAAKWSRRLLFWGNPWIWVCILLPGAVALGPVWDWSREPMESSRDSGVSIGDALPDRAVVWADGLVRSQPEILMYAMLDSRDLGKPVQAVWKPGFAGRGEWPAPGQYIVLRYDAGSDEKDVRTRLAGKIAPVYTGAYLDSLFTVYRVLP